MAYAFDENFNLYFASLPDSKHSVNILSNNSVCFSVFDSHQNWGEGIGLQIEGRCEQVSLADFPKVFKIYFGRNYPYGDLKKYGEGFKKLLEGKIYRFYKITPITFWMNDPNAETDSRVEVKP